MNLEELKKEELILLGKLNNNRLQQSQINQNIFLQQHGVEVGENISVICDGEYLIGKLKRFSFRGYDISAVIIEYRGIEKIVCESDFKTIKKVK